jgi:spermidine/putrescine transport system substrate-binding protein
VIADFTKKTGIKVNYRKLGSNEELINQMKASNGAGFDLCSPTANRSRQWQSLDLLQPFDYRRIPNIRDVNTAILKVGSTEWNFAGKGPHWLPLVWGSEAIAWRTDLYRPPGGIPSYGNIWDKANKGKAMIRPYSGMVGAGLYMESIGQLSPGDVWKGYTNEDVMRRVWAKITKFCVANLSQIKTFWEDSEGQKKGLLSSGAIVGQAWDGPVNAMMSQGEPVAYQAPKEGALVWADGLAMSAGARNVDEAYQLIKYLFAPEVAGKSIATHGYNSAVMGAENHASPEYRKSFTDAYPGKALARLNPWPSEPQWYVDLSTEFTNQFVYG